MQELWSQARAELSASKDLDNLARCVVASLFYFELESIPVYGEGRISGTGHILCRLRFGDPALEALLGQLSRSSAMFILGSRVLLGLIEDRSSVDRSGNFRKRVEFSG